MVNPVIRYTPSPVTPDVLTRNPITLNPNLHQVDEFELLKLRNPPGDHEEWKGDWGDSSTLWTRRYRKKMGFSGSEVCGRARTRR